ncbi:MAG TPA: hypothetical protein VN368_00470 [Candidatus Methylomirabilis sp.]|nr:hypothetical protein [Candidatus Methylomirabilis sp.]
MTEKESLLAELSNLLLNDSRKQSVLNYYKDKKNYENSIFLKTLVLALKFVSEKGAFHDKKTTRAAYTTEIIVAALLRNKTIVVVEPTNIIAEKTVDKAFEVYRKLSGDGTKKYVRHLTSNKNGCSYVLKRRSDNKSLDKMGYILGCKCETCSIGVYNLSGTPVIPASTSDTCMIKTIMEERHFLLSWNNPKSSADMNNLIEYMVGCGERWAQGASLEITKPDNSTIVISDGKRSATITKKDNQEKIKATLATHNGKIYWPIVEKVKKGIEIYGQIKPDVVTVTYDKLMLLYNWTLDNYNDKSERFREIIELSDILLLDEVSVYTEKLIDPLKWQEIKIDRQTGNKTLVLDMYINIHNIKSRLKPSGIDSVDKELCRLLDDFLIPFVNGIKALDLSEFKKQVQSPEIRENPLSSELDLLNDSKIHRGLHAVIEEAIIRPSDFGLTEDDCVFLDRMLQLICTERIIITWHANKIREYYTIMGHSQNDDQNYIKRAISYFKNKIVLLTDATMTPSKLEKITGLKNIELVDRDFGDPLQTNKKLLILDIQPDPKSQSFFNSSFDTFRWKYDYYGCTSDKYRYDVIQKIASFAHLKPIMWCHSKAIAEQIVDEFNMIYKGNLRADMLSEDCDFDADILVSYYKSSYSRVVECDRRVCILLSPAYKPRGCFTELAFAAPELWNPLDKSDRAKNSQVYNEIHSPNNPLNIPIFTDYNFDYFMFDVNCLQRSFSHADVWQAASRVKDPKGKKPSIVICPHWREKEVQDLCLQGVYPKYDITTQKKFFEDASHTLPSPFLTNNLNDVDKWLREEEIDVSYMNFAWQFAFAVENMFTPNRKVISQEMAYAQFIRYYSHLPNYDDKNGFFIGLINLNKYFGIYQNTRLDITTDGKYAFVEDKTDMMNVANNYNKSRTTISVVTDVLLEASKIDKTIITAEDIQPKINKPLINGITVNVYGIFEFIERARLLENSSWRVDKDKDGKYIIIKTDLHEVVLKAIEELTAEGYRVIKAKDIYNRIGLKTTATVIEEAFRILSSLQKLPIGAKLSSYKVRTGKDSGKMKSCIEIS